jgi:hypothetical protein
VPPGLPFRYNVLEKSCTRLLPFRPLPKRMYVFARPATASFLDSSHRRALLSCPALHAAIRAAFLLHEVQSESPRSSPNPAVPLMMAKHSRVLSFPRLVSGHFRCPAPPCTLCVQRPMLHGRTARATLSPPTRPAPVPVCDGLPVCSLSLREVFRPAIKPLGSVVTSRVPHAPAPPTPLATASRPRAAPAPPRFLSTCLDGCSRFNPQMPRGSHRTRASPH